MTDTLLPALSRALLSHLPLLLLLDDSSALALLLLDTNLFYDPKGRIVLHIVVLLVLF